DYRQSLYSLTNTELSGGNITEKLEQTEKSEYALLQTIIPNVDAETKSVLLPIYNKLEEKYSSQTEIVEVSGTDNANTDNTGKASISSQLKASVSRQEKYETDIATAGSEISDIENNMLYADRNERKRLQTELNEVTSERNGNVKSLREEKERFYAEIDRSAREQILNTGASTEYSTKYADYRQSLYSLTNTELSGGNITEKLEQTEKSEYALLQTIIPNVDAETKSVLLPIYNKLDEKYATEPTRIISGNEVASNTNSENNSEYNTSQYIENDSYAKSISRQEQLIRNIDISTKEIESLEQRKENGKKSEQKRLADEITMEESRKLDEIQKLAIEKSNFYSDMHKTIEISLSKQSDSIRNEYKSAYDSYAEALSTMKVGLAFYDMEQANKIYDKAEVKEYKLLQQMKSLASDDVRCAVHSMIDKMETKNPALKKYRIEEKEATEDEKPVISSNTNSANDISQTIVETPDSSSVVAKKKSMSGYSTDSYGIYDMPEINMGLYYRIQIIAVNVRYRMRDFNGLSLIFTELIPNTNLIRYMTGEYYRYASAREDLPTVRGLGFSDAFIVAYYNGKRISIAEARRLEAMEFSNENEEIPVVIRHEAPSDYVEPEYIAGNIVSTKNTNVTGNGVEDQNNVVDNSANIAGTRTSNSTNTNVAMTSGSAGEAGMTTEEAVAKGMYFAVQIGVYKDKRQPWQMKNITPIDYETMSNGFVRHTFGKFDDYNQARAAQTNIRRLGITDAFVIAYIDGRKVSFSEGIEYQKQMENKLVAQSSTNNVELQSKSNGSGEENLSNVEYAPLNLTTGTEENNVTGISYYVQIGAFSKSPDPEILSVFSKVAGDKIHVKFPHEGLQIYRIGVFSSYEEAQNTLAEARSFGIADAFIVAFKGDEQISSSEAIRLQNAVKQIEGNTGDTVQKTSSQNVSITSNTMTKPVVPAETLQQSAGGVEYFVQLGAFVNIPDARSMATFRSIATTNGSRLSTVQNGRFTNYRVGAFKKFADVKSAVDTARSMGVTDAFVVAFYNGERIPVAEAKEKE
ncbi:MAG: SPOR domain-containing protein, partial [Bacteroidales bacterium]|nr:SPOR domain-containing protein [Bacteroidales bacterium]